MKRLTLVVALVGLLVLSLVGGALADSNGGTGTPGNPATATLDVNVSWVVDNWIILYIPDADMNVSLGTVDSSYYTPSDTGGTWAPVTDGNSHSAWVITNNTSGYELTVSAVSSGTIQAALDRFQIRGGDLGTTWTPMGTDPTTPVTITLKTTNAAAIDHISDIQYQYLVNETDAPGDYAVTVTYTATTN